MIARSFAGRHLVISGVTGFLGKVWLAQLLDAFPTLTVTALVRAGKRSPAEQRLGRILQRSPAFRPLRRRHGARFADAMSARLRVCEVDLDAPDPALLEHLGDADLVVNVAGSVDFDEDPRTSLRVNVEGPLRLGDVAANVARGRLVHVSTCYVCGAGAGTVGESLDATSAPNGEPFDAAAERAWMDETSAGLADKAARIAAVARRARGFGWANPYTYTKALAERLLARRRDLALTIVRPSILECAIRFPFPGWNEGFKTVAPLALLVASPYARIPAVGHHVLDVLPVDLAGRGLTLACADALAGTGGAVWQLGTSSARPITNDRIMELLSLAVHKHGAPRGMPAAPLARWLEGYPTGGVDRGLASPGRLRAVVRAIRDRVGPHVRALGDPLARVDAALGRIERISELFAPFIQQHDRRFAVDRAAAASRALPVGERERFGFDVEALDWPAYWIDVQYPGLCAWCFPLALGGRIQEDEANGPPPALRRVGPPLAEAAWG
jgi:long-chain acyl-CoA synthetase